MSGPSALVLSSTSTLTGLITAYRRELDRQVTWSRDSYLELLVDFRKDPA